MTSPEIPVCLKCGAEFNTLHFVSCEWYKSRYDNVKIEECVLKKDFKKSLIVKYKHCD